MEFWGSFLGAIAGWLFIGLISVLIGGRKNE